MARKKTLKQVKALVERAKIASGNSRYQLDRMPKNHWMRKDQAAHVRKMRVDQFGKIRSGIKSHA